MPESQVLPIGQDGYFIRTEELIWIEDENRRRILTKDGAILYDSLTPTMNLVEPATRPPMKTGRVLEFDIQRFGHLHSDGELLAIRDIVRESGESLGRPLRIIDTFGWSGEIALAMCRIESSDTVTIVDDLSGANRGVVAWENYYDHCAAIQENLGPLLESRIQHSRYDAVDLPEELADEFDIVFIDTSAIYQRVLDLIDAWTPRLGDDGVFVGSCPFFVRMYQSICHALGEDKVSGGPVVVLSKRMIEAWHARQEEEAIA